MNKIKNFLLWLFGPKKTMKQCLDEVTNTVDMDSYRSNKNAQGTKPQVGLRLIKGNKK